MRNKIKHLIAANRLKPKGLPRVLPATVASPELVAARAKRRKRLKDIRTVAKMYGLPPGFYRFPTKEELDAMQMKKDIETIALSRLTDSIGFDDE